MNLPNKLTILRVLMVPVFIACFYISTDNWGMIAAVVFVAAFATDILDGAIARKYNLVTSFGKLMDPIADKLLTVAALVMLSSRGLVPPVATIIIIAREFIVSGVRMVALSQSSKSVIAASNLGKIKTVIQAVAISAVLLQDTIVKIGFAHFGAISSFLVGLSVAITVVSGFDYFVKNMQNIKYK